MIIAKEKLNTDTENSDIPERIRAQTDQQIDYPCQWNILKLLTYRLRYNKSEGKSCFSVTYI